MVINKLQKIHKSFYIILHKTFVAALGLKKGDYVTVALTKTAIRIAKLKIKKGKASG